MKNIWIWLVIAVGALYLLSKKSGGLSSILGGAAGNPAATGTPGTTTGTGASTTRPADSSWAGWASASDTTLRNTTASVNTAVSGLGGIWKQGTSLFGGLFGGASTATGNKANPSTNGSGAGVPTGTSRNNQAINPDTNASFSETYAGTADSPATSDTPSDPNQTAATEDPNASQWDGFPSSFADVPATG